MPSKEKKSELNFSLRLKSATKERKIWETNLKAYRNTCLNDTVRKIEQMSTGRKKKKRNKMGLTTKCRYPYLKAIQSYLNINEAYKNTP